MQSIDVLPQSIDKLTQSVDKWAHSTKDVHGKRGGVNTVNVGKLGMWTNQKMKYEAFIQSASTWLYKGHKKWQ